MIPKDSHKFSIKKVDNRGFMESVNIIDPGAVKVIISFLNH